MATVTGLTAARMQQIIDRSIVDADIIGNSLILTKEDGSTIDAGQITWSAPPRVSVLPGSPNDGDEIYFMADEAKGIIWHLRYNAVSASPYKWEFLGGSSIEINQTAATSNVSTAGAFDANVPDLTLINAGDYEVTMNGRFDLLVSGQQNIWRLVNPGNTVTFAEFNQRNSPEWSDIGQTSRFTSPNDNQILKNWVSAGAAGARQLGRRYQIKPIRVG